MTVAGAEGGEAVEALEGRLSSRFRIVGRLPAGQTLSYFRAEDAEGPRLVAALPVDCEADPETEAAFICAVFDLEALSGHGVPAIAEHGVEGGVPFVAYEPPPGRLLTEILSTGPLGSRVLLGIAEGILEALAAAQRHGIVHGELGPGSILVDLDGDTPVVTLLGVGLVPLVLDAQARAGKRSVAFAQLPYRAPELLAGGSPTERADLYAVGAIIHHMVSGAPPEGFESPSLYGDLPQLIEVVRRSMARDPARRYESADAMRVAVDWVEVESEKMNAHTQDIPLWMERSVVGSIPVPDLLRQRTGPQPLPGQSVVTRLDALAPPAAPPTAPPSLPARDAAEPYARREQDDPSIQIVHEAPEEDDELPLWAQGVIAAIAVAFVGAIAWLVTG